MFITQPLSQRDPRWKRIPLGFSRLTIGSDGCTLVCLAMIANGFGYSETPATLNDKLRALGRKRGFIGPRMVWAGLPRALPQIKLSTYVPRRAGPMDMSVVDDALARNKPVLVEVDLSPAPGFQNHWILIVAKRGDDYIIHDPWTVPAVEYEWLRKRYGYGGGPAQIIKRVLLYDNPAFNPNQPNPGTDATLLGVNDTPDVRAYGGLPLRESPSPQSASLGTIPVDALLRSQEPAQAVSDKLGVWGEWLLIETVETTARRGYVAAWLVHAETDGPSIEPGVETDEPAGTQGLAPADAERSAGAFDDDAHVQPPLERFAMLAVKRNAKLRAAPTNGKILSTLRPGALLEVAEPTQNLATEIKARGRWLKVRAQGSEGFVSSSFVQLPDDAADGPVDNAPAEADIDLADAPAHPVDARPMLRVASSVGLNLRESPSLSGKTKKVLRPGTLLVPRESLTAARRKIGLRGQWVSVSTLGGIEGFVAAEYVQAVALPDPLVPHQGVALANGDVLLAPSSGAGKTAGSTAGGAGWRVTSGTPLTLTQATDWPKIGDAKAMLHVRSHAFKEGYVRGSQLRAPALSDRRAAVNDAPTSPGTSAWIYGAHAPYERAIYSGSKTGWVVFCETVGVTGKPHGSTAYEEWKHNGYGVIARLNAAPGPVNVDAFADACRRWVRGSRGCRTWVIADALMPAISPESYAALFNKVRAAIKAVQPQAFVVTGALDSTPRNAASVLDHFERMLRGITDLDGIALRCATEGGAPAQIASPTTFGADAANTLPEQYRNFRAYAAFIDRIPARYRRKALYITQASVRGGLPQAGWAHAAFAEINRHNSAPHAQQIYTLALDAFPDMQSQLRDVIAGTDYRWRG